MRTELELAREFDAARDHLTAVALRMLGSPDEAEDAVQDAWLRASRADASGVTNLRGWLTTIVSRICLDGLRARRRRRQALGAPVEFADAPDAEDAGSPEEMVIRDESVTLALLVVLDRLTPAERVAFVLHDLFGTSFAEIAGTLDRSVAAAKKLASRARRRVHGGTSIPAPALARNRGVVDAFLAASRTGDVDALLAVLAPDVVRRADPATLGPGADPELRGARRVCEETLSNARLARFAEPLLVDGALGAAVAPRGRLRVVLRFTVVGDRIAAIGVVGDPERLAALRLSLLPAGAQGSPAPGHGITAGFAADPARAVPGAGRRPLHQRPPE